jgi:hypothetical protein
MYIIGSSDPDTPGSKRPFMSHCRGCVGTSAGQNRLRTRRGSEERAAKASFWPWNLTRLTFGVNTWVKTYLTVGPSLTRGGTLRVH